MEQQLTAIRSLHFLLPHKESQLLDKLPARLNQLADTVDSFYTLLGPRNWVFHDDLDLIAMADLVAANKNDPESAEQTLIAWYKADDRLPRLVRRLHRHEGLGARMHLLKLALDDFQAGRYYAVVQVLLSVMDGFVNDLSTANRKGLHARDPEGLDAWDSVVGHHLGLTNAHKSFMKSFKARSDEPVYDLYRNGIVHGTLTNYNNLIIATKAWNRVFAVADWVRATEAQQDETNKHSEVTWEEITEHIQSHAEINTALDAFTPASLTAENDEFTVHPAFVACTSFLNAWKSQNYGYMARSITKAQGGAVAPAQVRNEYQAHTLSQFHITAIKQHAAAITMVAAELTIDGDTFAPELRWMREDDDGQSVAPNQQGKWKLMLWGYLYMIRDTP